MNCTECRNLLSACEAGELAEQDEEAVLEHTNGCAECRRLLRSVRAVTRTVEELEDPPPPQRIALEVLSAPALRSSAASFDAPEIMTPEDLARFLRLSPEELDEIIDLVPGFELGGRLRFRKQRVTEWIESRERQREQSLAFQPVESAFAG